VHDPDHLGPLDVDQLQQLLAYALVARRGDVILCAGRDLRQRAGQFVIVVVR
jgi:hypothetical protein